MGINNTVAAGGKTKGVSECVKFADCHVGCTATGMRVVLACNGVLYVKDKASQGRGFYASLSHLVFVLSGQEMQMFEIEMVKHNVEKQDD